MTLELLEHDKICAAIHPKNLQTLGALEIFDTITSTNLYLLEQAKKGALSATACFAEQQSAGRGRLGRAWFSPFGTNIYFSFLWRFSAELTQVSGLSIAVAVLVARALRQYGVMTGVQLKWPNDVLFDGRKLAGILLERNDADSVVIGIGLNLDVMGANEPGWIDLAEITGERPQRNLMAGLLLNELLEKLPLYGVSGLQPYLAEWQKQDALFNQPVTVHTPTMTLSGVMRGLNEQGELLLQQENGTLQSFCYGEVSVRKVP